MIAKARIPRALLAVGASLVLNACGGGDAPPQTYREAIDATLERQQLAIRFAAADLSCSASSQCELLELKSPGKCDSGLRLVLSSASPLADTARASAAAANSLATLARTLDPDPTPVPCPAPLPTPAPSCSAARQCVAL